MKEYRTLKRGELTAIIIGTVVNTPGITAQQLVETLDSWDIRITLPQARSRLYALAKEGRIDRVGLNKYAGM